MPSFAVPRLNSIGCIDLNIEISMNSTSGRYCGTWDRGIVHIWRASATDRPRVYGCAPIRHTAKAAYISLRIALRSVETYTVWGSSSHTMLTRSVGCCCGMHAADVPTYQENVEHDENKMQQRKITSVIRLCPMRTISQANEQLREEWRKKARHTEAEKMGKMGRKSDRLWQRWKRMEQKHISILL